MNKVWPLKMLTHVSDSGPSIALVDKKSMAKIPNILKFCKCNNSQN